MIILRLREDIGSHTLDLCLQDVFLQLVDVFKESRVLDWDRQKVSEVFSTLGTLLWATSLGLLACLVEAAFAVCLQYFADV